MNEWDLMLKHSQKEMKTYQIGTEVKLLNFGFDKSGIIIEVQEPIGLLSPKYKCQWDDGDESGFLSSSYLEIVKE